MTAELKPCPTCGRAEGVVVPVEVLQNWIQCIDERNEGYFLDGEDIVLTEMKALLAALDKETK